MCELCIVAHAATSILYPGWRLLEARGGGCWDWHSDRTRTRVAVAAAAAAGECVEGRVERSMVAMGVNV